MNAERKFYDQIRAHLPGHTQRIESSTGSGIPDLNGCFRGVEYWVEFKVAMSGETILRKEQYAWGMRRACASGGVWIVSLDINIVMWKYPITVIPRGISHKYVAVTSAPHHTILMRDKATIKSILVPR